MCALTASGERSFLFSSRHAFKRQLKTKTFGFTQAQTASSNKNELNDSGFHINADSACIVFIEQSMMCVERAHHRPIRPPSGCRATSGCTLIRPSRKSVLSDFDQSTTNHLRLTSSRVPILFASDPLGQFVELYAFVCRWWFKQCTKGQKSHLDGVETLRHAQASPNTRRMC